MMVVSFEAAPVCLNLIFLIMRKISCNPRVSELHRVSLFAYQCGQKYNFVEQSVITLLTALSGFVTRLTAAIERDWLRSDLYEKDRARDEAFVGLYCLLKYFTTKTDDIARQAGEYLYNVIGKYRSASRKNYHTNTSLVEGLLHDLQGKGVKPYIAALGDEVAEAVQNLQTRQEDFKAAQEDYINRRVQRGETASVVCRELLPFMNNTFIPALGSLAAVDKATYGVYADEVDSFVGQINTMLRERRRKAQELKKQKPVDDAGKTDEAEGREPGDNTGREPGVESGTPGSNDGEVTPTDPDAEIHKPGQGSSGDESRPMV